MVPGSFLMPVYNFNSKAESVSTFDRLPDPRSGVEQAFSPLAIYDHEKPDLAYAERMAAELINLSGAWVSIFLKEPKADAEEKEVWDEDADPIYRGGKELKAFIKLDTVSLELTRWGIDVPLKVTVVFHRGTLVAALGSRLLAPGDAIRVPYNSARALLDPTRKTPFYFRILNVYDSGNFWYRWLYYTAVTELITGDKALRILHE
jgi:hypothetical protein